MFYDTRSKERPLAHDPFKAIVSPRPIAWISSISAEGAINLAPYSYFNGVSSAPPVVMFSSEGHKDSVSNIEQTKEFVCNLATYDMRHAVNKTSGHYPHGVNEMELAGLQAAPARVVKPPRVAASPCALECKLLKIIRLNDLGGTLLDQYVVFGQVIGIYIDDQFLKNGILDTAAMKPIARCGYRDYAVVEEMFQMIRPT